MCYFLHLSFDTRLQRSRHVFNRVHGTGARKYVLRTYCTRRLYLTPRYNLNKTLVLVQITCCAAWDANSPSFPGEEQHLVQGRQERVRRGDWCQCGHCSCMETNLESFCCKEASLEHLMTGVCITSSRTFRCSVARERCWKLRCYLWRTEPRRWSAPQQVG